LRLAANFSMGVRVAQLTGHTQPCVHLQASPHGGGTHDLASCGEDGWVRLWDLRAARAVRALSEPPPHRGERGPRAATCACHCPTDPHALFAAWSDAVYCFDLRTAGVLIREARATFAGGSEEVNSLAVSADGAVLVCGDDSGALLAWDLRTGERQLRVGEAHTSVLSVVLCHPRHALRTYSAGLDGRICAWSLPADNGRRGKKGPRGSARPLWARALLEEAQATASGGSNQLLNPRLAHAIALDGAGELLAAALGDGSIEISDAHSGQPLCRSADEALHADSACQVGFLDGNPPPAGGVALWSAGNDRLLRVWSLTAGVAGASGARKAASRERSLQPVFDVRLPHKPNWVAAVGEAGTSLCVADVESGTLALYELLS
jgi:WD40 repeat protein